MADARWLFVVRVFLAIVETSTGAPSPCTSQFHGCVTEALRNSTLALAQRCSAHCAPAGVRDDCMNALLPHGDTDRAAERPARAHCGFRSAAARAWLARVHAETGNCSIVLFSAIVGGTDPVAPPPVFTSAASDTYKCAVLFTDMPERAAPSPQRPTGQAAAARWNVIELPRPPIFQSAARTSVSLKTASMQLFPHAQFTLWLDGKMHLKGMSVSALLKQIRKQTKLPYISFAHYLSRGPPHDKWNEVGHTKRHVRGQRRPGLQQDLADIDALYARYSEEQAYNGWPGLIDTAMLVTVRTPPTYPFSGCPLLEPRLAIAALECAWHTEITVLSRREQLSVNYVLDLLGLRRYTYVFPASKWLRWFTWSEHLS